MRKIHLGIKKAFLAHLYKGKKQKERGGVMSSIWEQTVRREDRPPLAGDIQVQAVVIGGGMAGILTAKELAGRGVHTVVLEAGRLGGGQTGRPRADDDDPLHKKTPFNRLQAHICPRFRYLP